MFQSFAAFIRDDSQKSRNRKWLITAVVFLVLVVLALLLIPWRETWETLLKSNLMLVGFSTLLTIPVTLLSTASYYLVAVRQDVSQSFWTIFKINMIMAFYDIVLPSTFFVSGMRWYRYNQHSKKPAQILTSIAYLKAFKILFTLVLSLGLLLLFNTTTLKGYSISIIGLIIGIALILYTTPIISNKILARLPTPAVPPTGSITHTLFYRYIFKIIAGFANFQSLPLKTQFMLIGLETMNQGIHYYAYILIAESVGLNLSLAQLGAIRAILLLVANMPVNFSVGISLKDVTLVSLLAAINVPIDQAAAMSILVMAKNFIFGIVGGLIEATGMLMKWKRASSSN